MRNIRKNGNYLSAAISGERIVWDNEIGAGTAERGCKIYKAAAGRGIREISYATNAESHSGPRAHAASRFRPTRDDRGETALLAAVYSPPIAIVPIFGERSRTR